MDSLEFPASSKRELHGPRPTPLKVQKDSYKIKKPPIAPQQPSQPPQQHRPPIVIYTVSPKVIHIEANNFMTLVQRLTGAGSGASSSSSINTSNITSTSGAISPAARFAMIEKTNSSKNKKSKTNNLVNMDATMDRTCPITFPSILSPGPSSLPPISPNFFSGLPDQNSLGFLYDLSPIFHGNNNYIEGTLIPTPQTFFSIPITSINTSSSSSSHITSTSGAISPAARFAIIENTNSSENQKLKMGNMGCVDGVNMDPTVDRMGSFFPGILSPGPSSLPPISPNFFSGLPDHNSFGFLHDLISPIFHGSNKNYIEGNLIPIPIPTPTPTPTPTTLFSTHITSPTVSFDLLNQFLDF